MTTRSLARVVPQLRAAGLVRDGTAADAELLEQFLSGRDAAAFEVLVRRHGPMVFAVCRRVLRHTQDAEDAFQATFLVLAHKAATVSPRGNLAGWLHGVAFKTAQKARYRAGRRTEVETRVPPRTPPEMHPDTNWAEVEPVLDEELARLPDHYRLPIVMCDLEARLRTEVARVLGCSEGTLSSRLTRGRRLLADRLRRRGVHLSVAALAAGLTQRSAVAEPLIRATVPVALFDKVTSLVPPSVADLATGVMKSMFLKKLQMTAFAAVAVAALALTGAGAYRGHAAAPVPKAAPVPAADDKKLTESLADAEGRLLMNRKVLKDMKCDIDQLDRIMDALEAAEKKAIQKANEAWQLKMNMVGGAPQNPDAANRIVREAEDAGENELRKAVAGVVADVLTPAQRKRFRQIDWQYRGYQVFTSPTVIKALGITARQQDLFAANARQVDEEAAQAFQVKLPALPDGAAKMIDVVKVGREVRAAGMNRALAILTDEQRAEWKKLMGEPFTHPLPGNFPRLVVGTAARLAP
ncbi:sigma-70 family RNA polymerase sigma factor [Frigoriglobus tundricola]|uniref:ECF RNA polymerase sigma factor SigE n=1 Tax=Frigoriglobus tundricola TaxID=2774151 RepID=A0A6M5YKD2_9BACT|nr:sigma-70 family RNA polymerase sigma factor [Frigoriglobus tundricola]QJW94487.1 hypothetical protein FTUN_2008 [Frigoriglobus tundricola]